jgi:hypothetical protein
MTFGGFPVTCDAIGGAVSRDGEPAASICADVPPDGEVPAITAHPHTPAGTGSAFARISWRSVVNSEIVLVLDTITTLSM